MKFNKKLREIWHDAYYAFNPDKRVEFAMRCKDVAELIDLSEAPKKSLDRLRFKLHLSLCQPCQNYSDVSHALKKAVLELIYNSKKEINIKKLNKELIMKFTRKKT